MVRVFVGLDLFIGDGESVTNHVVDSGNLFSLACLERLESLDEFSVSDLAFGLRDRFLATFYRVDEIRSRLLDLGYLAQRFLEHTHDLSHSIYVGEVRLRTEPSNFGYASTLSRMVRNSSMSRFIFNPLPRRVSI